VWRGLPLSGGGTHALDHRRVVLPRTRHPSAEGGAHSLCPLPPSLRMPGTLRGPAAIRHRTPHAACRNPGPVAPPVMTWPRGERQTSSAEMLVEDGIEHDLT